MSRATLGIIVLSCILVALIVLAIVLSLIKPAADGPTETVVPDIREDEWLYNNTYPLAYERILESQIQTMLISNEQGTFSMMRWPDEDGAFWLGYTNGEGVENMVQYIPPIVSTDSSFDYESLYAIEEGDGFGRMYVLSYLCSAVGTPYFTERIDLPVGKDEESLKRREQLLKQYGLDGEKLNRISFVYTYTKDGQTKEGTHHIEIGAQALSGAGYYYRVDGRDCVYYTATSTFKYALLGFKDFVRGMLIAPGAAGDSPAAPWITTDFKEWLNTVHEDGAVTEESEVIVSGNVRVPIRESATYTPTLYPDGYEITKSDGLSFDLDDLKGLEALDRINAALVGSTVGDHSADPILISVIRELYESGGIRVSFDGKDALKYTYTISAIESVIDSGTNLESDTVGTPVSDNSKVKLTYTYAIDGVKKSNMPSHAIVDLASDKTPDTLKAALVGKTVGKLSTPITEEITYTKDTAIKSVERLVIADIIAIYDDKGAVAEKVTDTSYVSLRYYDEVDGVKGELTNLTVSIPDLSKDEKWAPLRDALIGKSIGKDLNTVAYSDTYYYEIFRDFYTVEVESIDYFVSSELIVSFKFVNMSERDPFYRESLYENTLDGKYSLYGLNANVCENVIKVLGGIGADESSTSSAAGFSGMTVAVGLTSQIMKDKNLYDYTVYCEFPSGVTDSPDNESDLTWKKTTGFTLYISREDPKTGKRYVGSDMYDLVAEVDGDLLSFVEYNFVEFWARRHLVLTDAAYVTDFDISFFMEDVYGQYEFDVTKKTVYIYRAEDGKFYSTYEYVEGASTQDQYQINVTEGEGSMKNTELAKYLERMNSSSSWTGGNTASMFAFYNDVMGGGEELFLPNSIETVGASNFALAFQVIQSVQYQGILTEDEQAEALTKKKLMSFRIKMDAENSSAYYYNYDFYRLDDRRVAVSMYQADEEGNAMSSAVTDFYLSTFAFKKIVSTYLTLLDAKDVDSTLPYPDEVRN